MGKIDFIKIPINENNENIERKYKFRLNKVQLTEVFELLSKATDNAERASFLYGYGKQSNSLYKDLKDNQDSDYKVIWFGKSTLKIKNIKTLLVKLFISISASTQGLIRINNGKKVKQLMEILCNLSMVGYFSISKIGKVGFEKNLFEHIHKMDFFPEDYIIRDSSFFYFIVDGDFQNDDEEYFCLSAFGRDCSEDLMKIIDYTEKRW